ncbi:peroxidase-like [Anthonomus grandis grandis]|uniref:peroxidase-like n=1 Tax=Anthonomus grandis grandis TaxID=2921223 RepID=UPI0021655DB8|nr:peroxidase-like [Anthonomus grandis grandis]
MNAIATKGLWYILLTYAGLLQNVVSLCPYTQISLQKQNELHSLSKKSNSSLCGTNPSSCKTSAYRSYDGSCNNLANPSWGTANNVYDRWYPADYGDGERTPRLAKNGNDLPSARKVSTTVYPSETFNNPLYTLVAMQYGQLIAHDMGSVVSRNTRISCCSTDNRLLNPPPDECYAIEIPLDDPVYSQHNYTCLTFTRPLTNELSGCRGEGAQVEQITSVTPFIDLDIIYGTTIKDNKALRALVGGKLLTNISKGQEMLPTNSKPNYVCYSFNGSYLPCYFTSDISRVNQNPELTILHIIFVREHNRIAKELLFYNPHWDDEHIFQEARKINIAQHQHISYYEYLPIHLGPLHVYSSKLLYNTTGFVDDYNETINPAVYNEHATAANRHFHTLIQGQLKLMNELRVTKSSDRLSNNFLSPHLLERDLESFDDLTRGMCTQAMDRSDAYHTSEITSHWLRNPKTHPIGQDLKSIDIQRGRVHGLASYNEYRKLCGLPKASTFLGFLDHISLLNVLKLKYLYNSPDDVDLMVGATLEDLVPGALAGPTNLCILTKQYYKTRVADRFWYEHSESGFSLPQLKQIRKASISKLICDNTNIKLMQPSGFKQIFPVNPLTDCDLLPSIDLSLWKDHSTCPDDESTTIETGSGSNEGITDIF